MKATTGSLLALLLAAASLTACGDDPAGTAEVEGDDVAAAEAPEGCAALQEEYPGLKGQKYDVGVSPGIGNYNNPNLEDPSNPDGLEPTVLRAAGECLGFTVTYKPQSFDALIPAMKSDRIQLISSGMYATEERAKEISFVTHLTAATAAVLPKGNPEGIESLDDTCGKKVAAVTGTVENEIEAGFAVPSEFSFGYGIAKDNTELIEGLHAALVLLQEEGTLKEVQEEWGFAPEQNLEPVIVA